MAAETEMIAMADWMHKSTVKFYERNPDAMYLPGFVSLSSPHIVKIMASGYEIVCRDTFFITCRARQILSDNLQRKVFKEEEVFKAERAINGHLEKLHEYFDTRISQGEQKLELAGFRADEMQRLVKNYQTKPVTNAVTQYVDLLAKADLYYTILHYLWLTSELSDNPDEAIRVKLNTEREVRDHLISVTRFSDSQYSVVRRICNGVVDQRRDDREKQSERDRLSHQVKVENESQAPKPKKKKKKNKTAQVQAIATAQSDLDHLSATQPAVTPVLTPVALPA